MPTPSEKEIREFMEELHTFHIKAPPITAVTTTPVLELLARYVLEKFVRVPAGLDVAAARNILLQVAMQVEEKTDEKERGEEDGPRTEFTVEGAE